MAVPRTARKADISLALGSGQIMCSLQGGPAPVTRSRESARMAARMTPNHVKHKLRAGTPSVGSWLNIGSPTSAETLAALGFDCVCVDMEHGQIDLQTLAAMLAAVGRYPVAPLARIPGITKGAIECVPDAGAWGFVAPDVRSREEVELMVAAA